MGCSPSAEPANSGMCSPYSKAYSHHDIGQKRNPGSHLHAAAGIPAMKTLGHMLVLQRQYWCSHDGQTCECPASCNSRTLHRQGCAQEEIDGFVTHLPGLHASTRAPCTSRSYPMVMACASVSGIMVLVSQRSDVLMYCLFMSAACTDGSTLLVKKQWQSFL